MSDTGYNGKDIKLEPGGKIISDGFEIGGIGIVAKGKSVKSTQGDFAGGMKLKSPDGCKWLIQVSNTGQLSAVKLC